MSTHFYSVEISFVDIVVELMTITVSFHNSHLYWLKKTKTKANKNKKQTKSHKKKPKTNKQTNKKKEKKEALYTQIDNEDKVKNTYDFHNSDNFAIFYW